MLRLRPLFSFPWLNVIRVGLSLVQVGVYNLRGLTDQCVVGICLWSSVKYLIEGLVEGVLCQVRDRCGGN